MSLADKIFVTMCQDILENGTSTEGEKVRPHWEDGTSAYTIKKFGVVNRYDLSKEFPAITLRKTAIKTCTEEMLWIWQRKSNNIHDLNSTVWDECHAGRMGRPGQTGHGARLAHQASHRPATAFTGLSRHLLWGERCSAGHQGESHLADGALLHPYHGRNLPLAHRTLHGEQAHAHPLRLADDGDMVPLHRHCQ